MVQAGQIRTGIYTAMRLTAHQLTAGESTRDMYCNDQGLMVGHLQRVSLEAVCVDLLPIAVLQTFSSGVTILRPLSCETTLVSLLTFVKLL